MKKILTLSSTLTLLAIVAYFSSCKCGCDDLPAVIITDEGPGGFLIARFGVADPKYTWSTGATGDRIPYPGPGTYSCNASGEKGSGDCRSVCTSHASITIEGNPGCGSLIKDSEGNTYNSVSIGTQCWLKDNLKTTKYQDGSAIEERQASTEWVGAASDFQGAWCYFNESAANNPQYGKLYSFYAVSNSKNVCPTGWHVPTSSEVNTLISFLGGTEVAGGKMKGGGLWEAPNTGADNSSGFNANPAGVRSYNGTFGSLGYSTDFWTSNAVGADAISFSLSTADAKVYINTHGNKGSGKSVRCIMD